MSVRGMRESSQKVEVGSLIEDCKSQIAEVTAQARKTLSPSNFGMATWQSQFGWPIKAIFPNCAA